MTDTGIIQVGNLIEDTDHWHNRQRGRVYSTKGIAPCINGAPGERGGYGNCPKVLIQYGDPIKF